MPVYAISARDGIGIDQLRAEIARRVAGKKQTVTRLEADLKSAAVPLNEASGKGNTRALVDRRVADLDNALADAAGVPTVVDAVERSTRLRAGPRHRLAGRLLGLAAKPDPLKKLHLDLGAAGKALKGRSRKADPHDLRRCSGPGSTPRCALWPTTPPTGSASPGWRRSAARPPHGWATSTTGSTRRSPPPTSGSRSSRSGPVRCACCSGC